jgi:uncharacterized protein YcbX
MSRGRHQLVEFLTALSADQDEGAATAVAARLAAEQLAADVGAVVVGDRLVATSAFEDAADLLQPVDGRHVASAEWEGAQSGRLIVARASCDFSDDERNLLTGMASVLGLCLRGIAALEVERVRQRLLETLLDIQRAISHRVALPEVLAAITEGASALLGGCVV